MARLLKSLSKIRLLILKMSNRTENNNEGITKFNFCCAFISLIEFEQETEITFYFVTFCFI